MLTVEHNNTRNECLSKTSWNSDKRVVKETAPNDIELVISSLLVQGI